MLITIWVVKGGILTALKSKPLSDACFVYFVYRFGNPLADLARRDGRRQFLLKPDWSKSNRNDADRAGSGFLCVEYRCIGNDHLRIVFGKDQDMFRSGNIIMWMNPLVSLLAGLVIFRRYSHWAPRPAKVPGLIFVVLPAVFMKIPSGNHLFAVFMMLVVFATLTSAFSMLEPSLRQTIRQR